MFHTDLPIGAHPRAPSGGGAFARHEPSTGAAAMRAAPDDVDAAIAAARRRPI